MGLAEMFDDKGTISDIEYTERFLSSGNENVERVPQGRELTRAEKDNLTKYANDRGLNIHGINKFDGDTDTLKAFIDEIVLHKEEFPRVFKGKRITLKFADYLPGDYASTYNKTITLNRMYFRDRSYTENDLSAFNMFSNPTIEGIAKHELGHIIENVHGEKGLVFAQEVYYNMFNKQPTFAELKSFIREEVSYRAMPDVVDGITGERYTDIHEITSEIMTSNKQTPFITQMKEKWRKEGLR